MDEGGFHTKLLIRVYTNMSQISKLLYWSTKWEIHMHMCQVWESHKFNSSSLICKFGFSIQETSYLSLLTAQITHSKHFIKILQSYYWSYHCSCIWTLAMEYQGLVKRGSVNQFQLLFINLYGSTKISFKGESETCKLELMPYSHRIQKAHLSA